MPIHASLPRDFPAHLQKYFDVNIACARRANKPIFHDGQIELMPGRGHFVDEFDTPFIPDFSIEARNLRSASPQDDDMRVKRTIELDAYFAAAHVHLAVVCDFKGMCPEALQECLGAKRLGDAPWIEGILGITEGRIGRPKEARRKQKSLEGGPSDNSEAAGLIAPSHATLGEKEQALAEMEQAYREQSSESTWMKVDPLTVSLRSEPRNQNLLRRVGFPA